MHMDACTHRCIHACTHACTHTHAHTPRSLSTDLLPFQVGHCVSQVVEAVFDVVTPFALQSIVVCPFVCMLQQKRGRQSTGLPGLGPVAVAQLCARMSKAPYCKHGHHICLQGRDPTQNPPLARARARARVCVWTKSQYTGQGKC